MCWFLFAGFYCIQVCNRLQQQKSKNQTVPSPRFCQMPKAIYLLCSSIGLRTDKTNLIISVHLKVCLIFTWKLLSDVRLGKNSFEIQPLQNKETNLTEKKTSCTLSRQIYEHLLILPSVYRKSLKDNTANQTMDSL